MLFPLEFIHGSPGIAHKIHPGIIPGIKSSTKNIFRLEIPL